jgi:hypothetical protein
VRFPVLNQAGDGDVGGRDGEGDGTGEEDGTGEGDEG